MFLYKNISAQTSNGMNMKKYLLMGLLVATVLGGGASLALAYANIDAQVRSSYPQMTQRLIVQISPSGQALVRGIVTSTGTNSLMVKSWGGNWNINVLTNNQVIPVAFSSEELQGQIMNCFPPDYQAYDFFHHFERTGFFRITDPKDNTRAHDAAMRQYEAHARRVDEMVAKEGMG